MERNLQGDRFLATRTELLATVSLQKIRDAPPRCSACIKATSGASQAGREVYKPARHRAPIAAPGEPQWMGGQSLRSFGRTGRVAEGTG